MRAGKREFLRSGAKVFAHGIPPDVGRDFFDSVRGAKNVFVITHLPEGQAAELSECEGSTLFEEPDKFAEIRIGMSAFRKKVEVIRHDAVRVEEKRVFRGRFEENLEDMECERCRREVFSATVAA